MLKKLSTQADRCYSDGISNKKIIILGRFPPPLGGIAIHIERVITKLRTQNNLVFFFDTGKPVRFLFFPFYLIALSLFLLRIKGDILYYHTLYMKYAYLEALLIISIGKLRGRTKFIIIDHNCRYLDQQGALAKKLLNIILKYTAMQIFIGRSTQECYKKNNMYRPLHWKTQAAFLPPDISKEDEILNTYPASLDNFLLNHQPKILVSAFKLPSFFNGKDLYGIDQSMDALFYLAQDYPKIGLVIVVGQCGDDTYRSQLDLLIEKHALTFHTYILSGQKQLWPLLKKIDIFIRPTLSDGDSISVREALYFNKIVIASNICKRPKGTIYYQSENSRSLYQQIRKQCHAQQQYNRMHTQSIK
jgi:glycosyltransferase involved in cell wall biosynthesis